MCRAPEREALRRGWGGDSGVEAARGLLTHLLERLGKSAGADVIVYHEGTVGRDAGGAVSAWRRQRGSSFGERLRDAVGRTLAEGYERVVVVGADIPHLRGAHVRRALELLDRHEVALGRDTGGGCYLIGLRAGAEDRLLNVRWGKGTDFERLSRAGDAGVLDQVLRDLDSERDITRLCPRGLPSWLRRKLAKVAARRGGTRVRLRETETCRPEETAASAGVSERGPPVRRAA